MNTEFPSFGICMNLANAIKINPKIEKIPQSNLDSLKVLAEAWGIDKDTQLN